VSFKPVEDNLFKVENIEKEKTIEFKEIFLMNRNIKSPLSD